MKKSINKDNSLLNNVEERETAFNFNDNERVVSKDNYEE